MDALGFIRDDGGRDAAGFRGSAGDCGVRAVAIATGRPYREVYDAINALAKDERPKKGQTRSSARSGVHTRTLGKYLAALGWAWVPTMAVGSGCKVHLRAEDLPHGRLIARVSGHYVAVIDHVIHDTYNPARGGKRCVYGYWMREEP